MKSKFIYIQPKNTESEKIFNTSFKQLHSCKVLKEKESSKYVKSIAGEYYFWVHENDKNWSVVK